jgi:hypothetical protein
MPNEQVQELLDRSQWVIEGTVQQVGAVTLPEVQPSAHTFVVHVDEVLHGPPEFQDHKGRQITLYSDQPKGLEAKTSAVFFTRSWLYGRTLAVIEVGRLPKEASPLQDDIEAAAQAAADRRLAARIAKAQLVVVGEVVDLGSGPELRRPVETEHHPEWASAFVKVQDALKGKPEGDTLRVVFPRSSDELWTESPKLEQGQRAILILQEDQQEKGWPVLRVPGLTALDPLDVQPPEQLDRVRKLVEEVK